MKKIWLSPYQLIRKSGVAKGGYLLRLQEDDFEFGYADIFPWPEFGDPALGDIPRQILRPEPPVLLQRSLQFARLDGQARARGLSLLPAEQGRNNHFLIEQVSAAALEVCLAAIASGFTKFKIKIGRHWQEEFVFLQKLIPYLEGPSLRLDLNLRGDQVSLTELSQLLPWVEFIEDPFLRPQSWLEKRGPWAYDQAPFAWQEVKTNWQVIKPARQIASDIMAPRWVCTSLLDHPVGIAHALAFAIKSGEVDGVDGLASFLVDQPTPFHEGLILEGARLRGPGELGIGFSELLQKQDWQVVR